MKEVLYDKEKIEYEEIVNKIINKSHLVFIIEFDHFGEKLKVTPVEEDIYQVEVEAQISPTFWGWFFQFVGDMEIVSPASLVKEYKKRLSVGNKITSKNN